MKTKNLSTKESNDVETTSQRFDREFVESYEKEAMEDMLEDEKLYADAFWSSEDHEIELLEKAQYDFDMWAHQEN